MCLLWRQGCFLIICLITKSIALRQVWGTFSLLKAVQTVQITLTNYTLNHTVVVIAPSATVG